MDMSGPAEQGVPSYHEYALKPPIPTTLARKTIPARSNRNVYEGWRRKSKHVLYSSVLTAIADSEIGQRVCLDCLASEHGGRSATSAKRRPCSPTNRRKKGRKTPAQIRSALI